MPIHVYKCEDCGSVDERIMTFSSIVDQLACTCGETMRRSIVSPGRVWAPTRNSQ